MKKMIKCIVHTISDVTRSLNMQIERKCYKIQCHPHPKMLNINERGKFIYFFIYTGNDSKCFKYGQVIKLGKTVNKIRPLFNHFFFRDPNVEKNNASRLASFIHNDNSRFPNLINEYEIQQWIMRHTTRIIVTFINCPSFTMDLMEGVFLYKYQPIYENEKK